MNQDEGYTVDPITRQNLDDALDRQAKTIEKNLELVISPIKETLAEHHLSLYGKGGSNGLTGTVKGLTLKVKLLIIVLGVFFYNRNYARRNCGKNIYHSPVLGCA